MYKDAIKFRDSLSRKFLELLNFIHTRPAGALVTPTPLNPWSFPDTFETNSPQADTYR